MTLIKCVECNINEFEKYRSRKYCDECKLKINRFEHYKMVINNY